MRFVDCMWCEKIIRTDSEICPECGLEKPVAAPPAEAKARRKRASSGGRRLILAVAAVPFMLSVAYAAHYNGLALLLPSATAAAGPVSDIPGTELTDPLQRSVWVHGERAVRRALSDPQFDDFTLSYVQTSDGQVVSLCGAIPVAGNADSGDGGERFISVFGQARSTVVEGRDASFGVLWDRVCSIHPDV